MIVRELRRIATAFTFMTRIPLVHRWSSGEHAELAASTRYFPLVGYVVGGLGAAVLYYSNFALSHAMAALVASIALVLLTGAFHEDGLADTADGFGGAFEPARKLEIMKDSRVGTYGVLALVAVFALRWQLLVELPIAIIFLAMISAHVLSRWSSLLVGIMLPYVREGASNKPIADGLGWRELVIGTVFAGLWMLTEFRLHAIAMVVAVLVCCIVAAISRRQIGGVTGDVLGASNLTVEIAVLITWSVAERMNYFWNIYQPDATIPTTPVFPTF